METETANPEAANLDASTPKFQPQINTYHCICSTLLLATTYQLHSLPRRAEPALDKAYILPLPPAARLAGETAEDEEENAERQTRNSADGGYALLLSTTQDRKPTVVRREDGFEKRILLRCGRCRIVVGYKLDPAHFKPAEGGIVGGVAGEGRQKSELANGDVEVAYLLPGGLVSSEELKTGKMAEVVEWRQWDGRPPDGTGLESEKGKHS
jgi:hypothetical protein